MNRTGLCLLTTCLYASSVLGAQTLFIHHEDELTKMSQMSAFDSVVEIKIKTPDGVAMCSATKIEAPGVDVDVYLTAAHCLERKIHHLLVGEENIEAHAYFLHPLYHLAPQFDMAVFFTQATAEKALPLWEGDLETLENVDQANLSFYHVGYGRRPHGSTTKQAFRVFPIFPIPGHIAATQNISLPLTQVYGELMGYPTAGDSGGPLIQKNELDQWSVVGVSKIGAPKEQNAYWIMGLKGIRPLILNLMKLISEDKSSSQLQDLTKKVTLLYDQMDRMKRTWTLDRMKDHPETHFFTGMKVADKDLQAARHWFEKAAQQGYREAQFSLGTMLSIGEGGPQDLEGARYWYKESAQQGDRGAQFNLGVMLSMGEGGPIDLKQARFWFEEAAQQGHDRAITILRQYFENDL